VEVRMIVIEGDYLAVRAIEDALKAEAIKRVIAILKSHDIEMTVSGCGCCGSPEVWFQYKGEVILDDGDANFCTSPTDA
jgi:hypothetical protein